MSLSMINIGFDTPIETEGQADPGALPLSQISDVVTVYHRKQGLL